MAELPMTKRVQTLVEETTQTVTHSPQRLIDASRGAIHMTREEAEHLLERGEDLFDKLAERGIEVERLQTNRVAEWWKGWEQRGRHQVTVAEEQMEQSMQAVLRALHIPTLDDVKRLDKELDRLAKKLDAHLTERELAALPIADYKGMNAKEVVAHLETLDMDGLQAVQKFEMGHHNRKTILREIDQRMAAMA
jgi:polyhydroxyalkanoate synthesis regulator phasin